MILLFLSYKRVIIPRVWNHLSTHSKIIITKFNTIANNYLRESNILSLIKKKIYIYQKILNP